jgi:AraC-like DNA-binding protein
MAYIICPCDIGQDLSRLSTSLFSSFVLGQRLSRAHRILSDPHLSDRNISAVVFDVGFGDLSYFNRAFRRRYAATPRDIRRSAIWPDASRS